MSAQVDPVGEGLSGAARLMLGDRGGLRHLDASPDALRLSFLGLALMVAIDASAAALQWEALPEPTRTKAGFVAGQLLVSLASYGAALGAVALFVRDEATRPLWPLFVTAQNWAMAVFSAATLPLVWFILRSGPTDGFGALLYLVLLGMAFVAWLRVVRIALDQPAGRAAIITVTSFVALFLAQVVLVPVLVA